MRWCAGGFDLQFSARAGFGCHGAQIESLQEGLWTHGQFGRVGLRTSWKGEPADLSVGQPLHWFVFRSQILSPCSQLLQWGCWSLISKAFKNANVGTSIHIHIHIQILIFNFNRRVKDIWWYLGRPLRSIWRTLQISTGMSRNLARKARSKFRWKWKKKRTRRLQKKRRKMRQRSKWKGRVGMHPAEIRDHKYTMGGMDVAQGWSSLHLPSFFKFASCDCLACKSQVKHFKRKGKEYASQHGEVRLQVMKLWIPLATSTSWSLSCRSNLTTRLHLKKKGKGRRAVASSLGSPGLALHRMICSDDIALRITSGLAASNLQTFWAQAVDFGRHGAQVQSI